MLQSIQGGSGTLNRDQYWRIKIMGFGTFGRVVECSCSHSNEIVAIRTVWQFYGTTMIKGGICKRVNYEQGNVNYWQWWTSLESFTKICSNSPLLRLQECTSIWPRWQRLKGVLRSRNVEHVCKIMPISRFVLEHYVPRNLVDFFNDLMAVDFWQLHWMSGLLWSRLWVVVSFPDLIWPGNILVDLCKLVLPHL
jgi:hypothetical protein